MHRSFVQYKLHVVFHISFIWGDLKKNPGIPPWSKMKSKFTEMASIREMFKRSSIVAILINNCSSSSGSYSNFCLKLLSIQDFSDSLMISHFFLHLKLLLHRERKRGKLNLIWVLISNLFFKSSSSCRTCCSSQQRKLYSFKKSLFLLNCL